MKGISDDERLSVKESWDKIVRWATRRRAYLSTKEDVLASTKKVAIMGGGSFGTAMGTLLARNKRDLDVVILVRSDADARSINETHRNAKYLPQYELPPSVRATTDPAEALSGCDFIVHAVPVQSSKAFLRGVKDHVDPKTPLLCLAKGLGASYHLTLVPDDRVRAVNAVS
jgi:glycerol-3-phosphate dehydrogenase (NAD+)